MQIALGMQWCVMFIFLFLKSDNFIKGIVCIYIVFFKKLRTLLLYLAYYSQTCSNDHLNKMTTCHLRHPILSPPEQIPRQSLLYKTTTCLTQPAITFFALKKKKVLSKITTTKLYLAKKQETNIR